MLPSDNFVDYESGDEMVSHPAHYQSPHNIEVIDVIKQFTSKCQGIEATDTGNIIKYACRWNKKNGIQDLEKMIWYASNLVDVLRNKENDIKKELDIFDVMDDFTIGLTGIERVLSEKIIKNACCWQDTSDLLDLIYDGLHLIDILKNKENEL